MKNTNQVDITSDRSVFPYVPTSTAIDMVPGLFGNSGLYASYPAQSHDCTPLKSTHRRRRNKRRNIKVFKFQFITVALCIVFLFFSFITIYDSLCLFSIGNEIDNMGIVHEGDSNYPRYCELMSNRDAIGNSSWIGYLLVVNGTNDYREVIRDITVVLVGLATILVLLYIRYIIIVDIEYFEKH